MKKITTLVLSLVLVLAMSITAFAATPNDEVKAALTEAGVTGEYYDQAVKFLANNELTAEQATAVKNEIKAAKEKLMTSAQNLFAKMYEANQAAGGAAGAGPDMGAGAGSDAGAQGGSTPYGDDVVDGDYKEV